MKTGASMAPRSSGSPQTVSAPGFFSSFCRYMWRRYQQYIGPGRLVLSPFQYSRSKGGGVSPFR
jgi:hypothetical protein